MRVLAQSEGLAYLVQDEGGRAYVLDIEQYPVLSEPRSVDSLLTTGYWEAFEGDEVPISGLVRRLLEEGEPLSSEGPDPSSPGRALRGVTIEPEDLRGVQVEVDSSEPLPVTVFFGGHTIQVRLREQSEPSDFPFEYTEPATSRT